jgi:hypothetical protein
MALINVASNLPMALQMQGDPPDVHTEPAVEVIAGERAVEVVSGFGITRGVDEAVFDQFMAKHQQFSDSVRKVTDEEIENLGKVDEAYGYEKGLEAIEEAPSQNAPTNVDVPHVSQNGNVLNCTMGNWRGEPDSYDYQWEVDGVDVGSNAPDYPVAPGDVGKSATCTVTATNEHGSTIAQPSVPITVD